MPACAPLLKCNEFLSAPKVKTSDHKPVYANFTIKCTPQIQLAEHGPAIASVTFSRLSAKGTRSMDRNGKSDPYVSFYSDPSHGLVAAVKGCPLVVTQSQQISVGQSVSFPFCLFSAHSYKKEDAGS
jgi:hypothetical protein